MKTLFNYSSYREFLSDCFLREKKSSRKATLAIYARKFGLSTSGFNMVLSGQRNLTIRSIHDVAQALRFSIEEYEYFEALVLREQSVPRSNMQRYYDKRLKKAAQGAQIKRMRVSDNHLLSSWAVPALLIYLIDFELKNAEVESSIHRKSGLISRGKFEHLDLNYVARKFNMNVSQLQSLIEHFSKSGFFEADSNSDVHLIFEKLTAHAPQKQYIKSVTNELARRIEQDFSHPHSLFRAFVFTMDQAKLGDLRSELTRLFEKYMTTDDLLPSQKTLVQAMVGVFPV